MLSDGLRPTLYGVTHEPAEVRCRTRKSGRNRAAWRSADQPPPTPVAGRLWPCRAPSERLTEKVEAVHAHRERVRTNSDREHLTRREGFAVHLAWLGLWGCDVDSTRPKCLKPPARGMATHQTRQEAAQSCSHGRNQCHIEEPVVGDRAEKEVDAARESANVSDSTPSALRAQSESRRRGKPWQETSARRDAGVPQQHRRATQVGAWRGAVSPLGSGRVEPVARGPA